MSALLTALIFFLFVSLPPASAEEENPLTQWTKEHVKGSFRYKNFAHFKDTEPEQRTVRQEGILRLEVEQAFEERWRLFLMPQWKADTANYTAGGFHDFRDTYLRDSYFSIREGHLKYRGEDFDVTVGKQIYTWGTADGYNPTDNLNPRNYLDVPQREKLGTFSLSASYYPPDSSLTLVVIPLFTPSRLPVIHSRWIGNPNKRPTSANDPDALNADLPPGTSLKRREMPGKRLDKIQMGLRAKTTLSGWDLSLSYFDGYDTLPVVRLVDTTARPRFNRMHVIGSDFSTTTGKLEYHGEFAWKTYDGGRATDILPFVIGGMYIWDEDWVKNLGLDQIQLNLEYAGEFTLHQRDNRQYRETGIFTRPFQNSILSRVAFKFDENNELHVSASGNFHHHNNSYLQPKFVHKYSDSVKIEGGWEVFWGPQNSFWGKWRRNDRTFLFMTYLF
jgi:hypothetical protein